MAVPKLRKGRPETALGTMAVPKLRKGRPETAWWV